MGQGVPSLVSDAVVVTSTAVSRERRRGVRQTIAHVNATADTALLLVSLVSLPTMLVSTSPLASGDKAIVRIVTWVIWSAFLGKLLLEVASDRARRWDRGVIAGHLAIVVGLPVLVVLVNITAGLAIALVHPIVMIRRGWRRRALGRRIWRFVTDRPLHVLAVAVPFMWLLAASLVLRVEYRETGTLNSIGSALWWSAATMSTVGYGDVTLVTAGGRIVGVGTMVVGIASFSVLTAKLAESLLVQRDLRAHAEVDVDGHTLILGWSPKVFTIVRELILANADQPRGDVVVVGDWPTPEMERELVARVPELVGATTVVICRTGTSWEQVDIARAHPERARAVVVLDDAGDSASVIKTVLVLLSGTFALEDIPVVAEVSDAATAVALERTFGSRILPVEAGSLLARVTAQSCRQPGLGLCYQELFDFHGSEMYVVAIAEAAGSQFGDLLSCFERCIPVGIVTAHGDVAVCPPMDRVVCDDDRLVLLAEDDSLIAWTGPSPAESHVSIATPHAPAEPEHILIFGWNDFVGQLLTEIDRRVPPGSRITVAVDTGLVGVLPPLTTGLRNAELVVRAAAGAAHADLVALLAEEDADHTIVLCYGAALSPGEADARALLTMLQIRRALTARGQADRSIVCELLDERDVDLAPAGSVSDFIVSQQLTSLMLAQLAECPQLAEVFRQIFDPAGAELYSAPASSYCRPGTDVPFANVVAGARVHGQVALGYRLVRDGDRHDRNFGVVINPPKTRVVHFEPDDRILLLSQPVQPG